MLVSIGISIRLWLIFYHFPHYDDLWGYYRAIHIKLLSREEFYGKLPYILKLYSDLFASSPFLDWILRHFVSVREATFHTTLAPLHYFFSFLFTGFAKTYPFTLAEARITTFLEYLLFLLLFFVFSRRRSEVEKTILIVFLLLSLFGSLPLFYSVQGHNYMTGVVASVVYLLLLDKLSSTSCKSIAIRAFLYCVCIHSSYNFIILLPSYYASELFIFYRRHPSIVLKQPFKLKQPCPSRVLGTLLFLSLPLITSLSLKALYIMPGAVGHGWNSGFHNEYIVTYESLPKFFGNIYYSFSSTLSALYMPTTTSQLANAFLFFLLIPFVLIGMLVILRYPSKSSAADIFSLVSLLTFFVFYLLNYIAISPTRHSLILYTFIAIIFARGLSFSCYHLRDSKIFSTILFSIRLDSYYLNASLISLLIIAVFFFCNAIPFEISSRKDPLTPADISLISKSHSLYYDPHYNFSLSVAPELRHMKEVLIPWTGRIEPVIKKSISSKPTAGDVIVYATNSFEEKNLPEVIEKIRSSTGCLAIEPLQPVRTHVSRKIVDATPLTNVGTNTLRLYKTICR